ncbi:ankyrin repeat domain-containing protein [Ignatzschineria rhizosphaerae]|uniref:Ankyrin repeat domain-containing protein n=1 Tax=Ignatzschineria rhizosphaerae TaxID=2923279 RepID=A0ABY3XAL0_9GAMM|nr:ankyrin repeat domain-containing protein [Ignatzschineria rhizosphaerae]UNM96993.1 ankyrin repeat domain-containing protein [Ignatzschineria rhizosphaerae]
MNPQITNFFENIKKGNIDAIKTALIDDPKLLHAQDSQKRTTLLTAAMHQQYALCDYFIEAGVDLNLQDNSCLNPFLWAIINNDLKLVKRLIKTNNVDLKLLTRFGGNGIVPAAEKGHLEIVEYLLTHTDINPNHTNNLGWTALIEAIILNDGGERQQKIIELLLKNGADPNMVDAYGKTPLTLAKEKGYLAIAEILLNYGGK